MAVTSQGTGHIFMGELCIYIFVILTSDNIVDGYIFSNDITVFPLCTEEWG